MTDKCPKCNAPRHTEASPGQLRSYQCMSGIHGVGSGFEFVQSDWCKEVEALRTIVGPLEELLATGEPLRIQQGHGGTIEVVAQFPDGDYVDEQVFEECSLAEALDAANTARETSES